MNRVERMRRALLRSNTRLLLLAVVAFQAVGMGVTVCRDGVFHRQALILTVATPLLTCLLVNLVARLWPIDRAILILTCFLLSCGLITLSAIARAEVTPGTHAVYILAGLAAMIVGIVLVRAWKKPARWMPFLAGGCLLALLSPWAIGQWHAGARNWITVVPGLLTVQPSEFMKPVLIAVLAWGFSGHPRFARCLAPIAFSAACCAVLLSERDLGAVLLYFLVTVLMYYAATGNAFVTLFGLAMGAAAAVIAYRAFPYVQDRIAIWQNPWLDPEDTGYQIVQALIAIGSGSLFGQGLGLGSPRNVPLYHSDFIFASIAEEFGLIFAVCVLAVYVLIVLRGLIAAMNARTSFHSLMAFGLVILFALQAMLIAGGNTKLLPLTGVTLPLVSYGGSSLMSTLFSIGLLLGISSMNAQDEMRDIELIALREGA